MFAPYPALRATFSPREKGQYSKFPLPKGEGARRAGEGSWFIEACFETARSRLLSMRNYSALILRCAAKRSLEG